MAMMNQEEVKSEKIELWAAVLKYLGFRSQVEVDDKQSWNSWLTSSSSKECACTPVPCAQVVQYEIWCLN